MDSYRVKMGNDEFILFIRKNFPNCNLTNDIIGKRIWAWLNENASAGACQIEPDKKCYWVDGNDEAPFLSDKKLPKTATQFEFNSGVLPSLYNFLGLIGDE